MPAQQMVSCICPTYNRAPYYLHLLNECAYWFTQQRDPGPCELIICNDCPGQTLKCDVPGVRIINLPYKIASLGEKYNFMVKQARGDIILPWEDDDISLPHRIRQCRAHLGEFDYYNPQYQWYEDSHGLHSDHKQGVCHNSAAFRKGKLTYPVVSGPQDQAADMYAKAALRCSPVTLPNPRDWDYVYRFGVSNYHLSGFADTEAAYAAKQEIISGTFYIVPTMYTDYVKTTGSKLCGRDTCSVSSGCVCRAM